MSDSPPPIEDVIASCGALPEDAGPSAVQSFLDGLAEHFRLADSVRREYLRQAGIAKIRNVRTVIGPVRIVDARLAPILATIHSESDSDEGDDRSPDELYAAGAEILEAPDQGAVLRADVARLGYAGQTGAVELLDLAIVSRSLERPINVGVHGASAAGKSFTVDIALRFHPPEAVYRLTSFSERALAYTEECLEHRVLYVAESSGLHHEGVGASILRELAWSNCLRYEFVEKTQDGLATRLVEKPGPTSLCTTTTRDLDHEVGTRLLQVHVVESPAQTRAVVLAIGAEAEAEEPQDLDLDRWHAARRWIALQKAPRVLVPFAKQLAEGVPVRSVRMRRDFLQILSVIRASAFAHQVNRDRTAAGGIVAGLEDYASAYRLLGEVLAVTIEDQPPTLLETVQAVADLERVQASGVSVTQLAEHLRISKSAASRRKDQGLKRGYIVNAEERHGHPSRLKVGEPLTAPEPVLPHPDEVAARYTPSATLRKSGQPRNTTPEVSVTLDVRTVAGGVADGKPLQAPSRATVNATQQAAQQSNDIHTNGLDDGVAELTPDPKGDRGPPTCADCGVTLPTGGAGFCDGCGDWILADADLESELDSWT